ncbi:MAG: class II glutamine amidotransferase [Rhizobiaceae bacterium]
MCRWAAYLGEEVFLEEIVAQPCHSLIRQSHCAAEARSATNADGFGLAWYAGRPEPGLYRDILPAWSDPNLKSLCRQIRSGLFLAHVRAATTGATARFNCHPFVAGRWSFMHNGEITGFEAIRRRLEAGLADRHYDALEGTTDSELFFRLVLDRGLESDPEAALGHAVASVLDAQRRTGIEPAFKLTAAFSDGERLFAVRYATGGVAPTLYTSMFGKGRCLVSEPFDREGGEWHAIPPSSIVIVSRAGMTLRPFEPVPTPLALAG